MLQPSVYINLNDMLIELMELVSCGLFKGFQKEIGQSEAILVTN